MSGSVGRLVRVLPAALVALALLLPAAPRAMAAGVTFGTPSAETKYLDSITFTVPIDATVPLKRVELRLQYPGSIGPYIVDVPVPPTGQQTLTHQLDLSSGAAHLYPNSVIEATWAAIPQTGGDEVLSTTQTVRYQDTGHEWQTLVGDLVVVHWYQGGQEFARQALQIADTSVQHTAGVLGVTVTDPIDFYIYGDQASFRDALGPGAREWSVGTSISEIRTLFGLITPDQIGTPAVDRLVSHELVHLVFDTADRNPYRYPPHWFDEGLATYLSEGYAPSYRGPVEDAARSGELIPLVALTSFPTFDQTSWLAYSESTSAIDYLVRTYGQQGLLDVIDGFRHGLTDDEAFTKATGKDFAAFESGWLSDIGGRELDPYGPKPNPAGPVPPGWSTSGSTPAPGGAEEGSASGGSSRWLILGAILGVVMVVVVGLLVARRRAAAP